MAPAPAAAPDLDRETFQTAFKFAPIGMAFLSLSGRWLRANRALLEILGQTEPDLLATTMEALLSPDDVEPVARYLQNIRDGAILGYQMEVRYRHPRGNPAWVLQSAALIPDADGSPSSLLVQIQDITLRKKAEEELARLSRQNELVLRSAAEGIMGLNVQGNHTFVNPAAARMLGYEAEELLGRPSHSTWHHTKPDGSPYPREECPIYAAFRDGAVHRVSTDVFWRKDGTSFPVEYASTPIYEQDRLAGAVVTFTDITLRKRAEEERERLIAELKDALAKVKTLSGLLPICASCKKVRDDKGYWNQIEVYIRDRSEADFSHGICPDCAKRLYPEIYEKMMLRKENGGQS